MKTSNMAASLLRPRIARLEHSSAKSHRASRVTSPKIPAIRAFYAYRACVVMTGPKSSRPSGELSHPSHPSHPSHHTDLSHHPTRKVDSMSSLVAEMLLRDSDPDATAPALPALPALPVPPALADDDASLRAMRPKSTTAVWLVAAVAFLAALAAAAFVLSR
jgi:hypothetical protein